MKKIKELYKRYKRLSEEKGFLEKYPEYNKGDGKIHLLFIAPCLNGSGYYRAILPTLELNQMTSHCAIITEIPKWDFTKRLLDYVQPVDKRLIEWADYVIFPSTEVDISYLIQGWKTQNKAIQFVMDLDQNIHALPRQHPEFLKINSADKKQLLKNISLMDLLTGASEGLLDYYENLIEKYHPSSGVMTGYLPNLVSLHGYEELSPLEKNESSTIRIGIIGSSMSHYDSQILLPVLMQINQVYEKKIVLVLFGCNEQFFDSAIDKKDLKRLENLKSLKSLKKSMKIVYQKSVRFLAYFEKLNELALDIALMPTYKIPFNTHGKSFIKYLELSVLSIPVIASNHSPYSEVIEQGETGFLVNTPKEWIDTISLLINDTALRNNVGKNAMKQAWSKYSYTRENLKRYQRVFK